VGHVDHIKGMINALKMSVMKPGGKSPRHRGEESIQIGLT
jgi:hypothetical protein